jgi:hypothetical protein
MNMNINIKSWKWGRESQNSVVVGDWAVPSFDINVTEKECLIFFIHPRSIQPRTFHSIAEQ